MPLSIFIDALPYNEIIENYSEWFENMQAAELLPNVGYSSSLHWQLYCDRYPDERGIFVDWVREPESQTAVRFLSKLFAPLDCVGSLGFLSRKVLDRFVFHRNAFANIPYRFRSMFSEKGEYLFENKTTYGREKIFDGYTVISQDEGHLPFETVIKRLDDAVTSGDRNLFVVLWFADAEGHACRRGELYSRRLRPYMDTLRKSIRQYISLHPDEEILIVSDHGMSTVNQKVDLELQKHFGKPGEKTYVAYSDTAMMCIWAQDEKLREKLKAFLSEKECGHLLTESDRQKYGITSPQFGDIIFNLCEGYVFADNWFGKSIRRPRPEGCGMHGFWPERSAHDQMACTLLINGKRQLERSLDYGEAHRLIKSVMQEDSSI